MGRSGQEQRDGGCVGAAEAEQFLQEQAGMTRRGCGQMNAEL